MDDLSAPDLSAPEGASDASPSAPDRATSLSARLSEALTAVGIAVRRREAEIELIDRTLAASSDAQSAAAQKAAERMARVRAEHADELSLMQRARRALEDATSDAGELSYQLDTHVEQSGAAAHEAEELRRTVAGLRSEIVEQRSRVTETEAFVIALGDELEEAKRSLTARERELEQAGDEVAARERELAELRKELAVKTREAEELGRLMGAFTAADAASSADDVVANGDREEAEGEPPAPPDAPEPPVAAAVPEAKPTALPRFAEAPDIDIPVPLVEDAMDEMAGVDAMPAPDSARAGPQDDANEAEASADAAFEALDRASGAADDDPPGAADPSGPAASADAHDGDGDADDESRASEPKGGSAQGDDDIDLGVEVASEPADDASAAAPDDVDDAAPDAPVDISVDDWGAVVEPEAAAVALPGPATDARAAVDGELQAYLSAMGDDEEKGAPPSADALFKATSDIASFQCGSPEEIRLAGALQLQSWRPSELAQLIGMKEDVVRAKLATYHERGLVEIIRA